MTFPRFFPWPRLLAVPAITLILASCSSMQPADFAKQGPLFDVETFYAGHTKSTGLVQGRGGEPFKRVQTETWGHLAGGELKMTQDITIGDSAPTRRQWIIHRIDEHHYQAHCDNMIG
ncbi:MAG: lipoprotein, partial [Verrucomicrobiaceae bacterium]|nr:lipoprotein [Verrucomicrobiaceae bacterium]